jgi:hypothetical protein
VVFIDQFATPHGTVKARAPVGTEFLLNKGAKSEMFRFLYKIEIFGNKTVSRNGSYREEYDG